MTDISTKTTVLLTLSMIKGVGPAALRNVARIPFFEEEGIRELLAQLPRNAGANIDASAVSAAVAEAGRQSDMAQSAGARIISTADPEYPLLLKTTKDDPQILFVKGKLAEAPEKSVAIIGTREPTEHGKIIANRLTKFFVDEGWSVVSGLALGCDALAHEATLDAGGHTVAVLAHGLQTVAPSRHKKLAARILESGGALVTEYKFGQEPLPTNFVKRDRIQAGFAQGVVMIQSDLVGGSLHASRASIGYGRWLAVPFPTDQDISRSEPKIQANLLLADGTPKEKAALLKCEQRDLERIITLRSKSDYARMLRTQHPAEPKAAPVQEPIGDLFSIPPAAPSAPAHLAAPTLSQVQQPPKVNRVNQILLEHIKMVEEQLEFFHRGFVELGQEIGQNDSYQQLMRDFAQLQESLQRVRQLEFTLGREKKGPQA